MKNTVKRIVNFRFNHYKDLELKLEEFAAKGLFLVECAPFWWSFEKGEPQKRTYTVTYFSEGSVFNPDITENQQTYFAYAKAAGWNFVTQFSQMQIFCSEAENPVPFETDEREKLKNIKKCMSKNFLPSTIALIVVFSLNLLVHFSAFRSDPVHFLSNAAQLLSAMTTLTVVLYYIYLLADYFLWCKRSDRSIACGGGCIENTNGMHRLVDTVTLSFLFFCLGLLFLHLAGEGSLFSLAIGIMQVPLLFMIFRSSIAYLKKKKASAMLNRVISFTVLIIVDLAYLAFIILLIFQFGFQTGGETDYRTVTWQVSPTESHDYRLYSDPIPLTCEDLYGQIAYDYYSYEETVDSTLFLTKSSYRQDSLPAKDAPPRLAYEVLESKFDFVQELAKKHLLEDSLRWAERSMRPIGNDIFGTVEAYQKYYGDDPQGHYILLLEGKIIVLELETPVTPEQITVIREKLQF